MIDTHGHTQCCDNRVSCACDCGPGSAVFIDGPDGSWRFSYQCTPLTLAYTPARPHTIVTGTVSTVNHAHIVHTNTAGRTAAAAAAATADDDAARCDCPTTRAKYSPRVLAPRDKVCTNDILVANPTAVGTSQSVSGRRTLLVTAFHGAGNTGYRASGGGKGAIFHPRRGSMNHRMTDRGADSRHKGSNAKRGGSLPVDDKVRPRRMRPPLSVQTI